MKPDCQGLPLRPSSPPRPAIRGAGFERKEQRAADSPTKNRRASGQNLGIENYRQAPEWFARIGRTILNVFHPDSA